MKGDRVAVRLLQIQGNSVAGDIPTQSERTNTGLEHVTDVAQRHGANLGLAMQVSDPGTMKPGVQDVLRDDFQSG